VLPQPVDYGESLLPAPPQAAGGIGWIANEQLFRPSSDLRGQNQGLQQTNLRDILLQRFQQAFGGTGGS